MADYPPFMNSSGTISKILDKIKEAKTPARFTQDFLATNLGFLGGSPKAFLPLAKRIGFLSSDGTPTDLYHQFRNPNQSKHAMAKAIRHGYAALYDRNEYAHKLNKEGLDGLIIQATGLDKGSNTLYAIRGSFEALKKYADFDAEDLPVREVESEETTTQVKAEGADNRGSVQLNLGYTINLNLPKSDDIAVFNAIFKALREHLLTNGR